MEKTNKSYSGAYILVIIILAVSLYQTYDSRYNAGYNDGYDVGYEEGDEHGYQNGHYDGEGEGYDKGYNDAQLEYENQGTYEGGYNNAYIDLVGLYEDPDNFNYTDIPMMPVSSSFIDSVGYSPHHSVLLIHMNGKNLYAYHGVRTIYFFGLVTAESPGTYFNTYIKDKYEYTKYY